MRISQVVKLSPRKNKQLSPEATKLTKDTDQVYLIPKPLSFPTILPQPWALIMGNIPHPNTVLRSQRLWISCQGSSSSPRPGSLPGREADGLFPGHRSGVAASSVPVCLLLPPLIQTFRESVMVKSTGGSC